MFVSFLCMKKRENEKRSEKKYRKRKKKLMESGSRMKEEYYE